MSDTSTKKIRLLFAIGIGGMIGAVARYSISLLYGMNNGFPYGTLTANLIGCLLLSFLMNHELLKQKIAPELLTALTTGLIGAFTTFSTFTVETVHLWEADRILAIFYVLISVIGGLLFCYAGFFVAQQSEKKAK